MRWQLSAWVMLPVMLILQGMGLPLWINLMLGQAFGAFIFWEVDKFIFKSHKTDNIEDSMTTSTPQEHQEPSVSERKL